MSSYLQCIAGTARHIKREGRIILIDFSIHASDRGGGSGCPDIGAARGEEESMN